MPHCPSAGRRPPAIHALLAVSLSLALAACGGEEVEVATSAVENAEAAAEAEGRAQARPSGPDLGVKMLSGGATPRYGVALGPNAVDAYARAPDLLATALWSRIEQQMVADLRRGAWSAPRVEVEFLAAEEVAARPETAQLILDIGARSRATTNPDIRGVEIAFEGPPALGPQELSVGPLSPRDQRYLDAAAQIWPEFARAKGAPEVGPAGASDALAAAMVDEGLSGDDGFQIAVISLGVWFGDQLVRDNGFRWGSVENGDVTEPVIFSNTPDGDVDTVVFPLSVVAKRLQDGGGFDPRQLVTSFVSAMRESGAAPEATEPSAPSEAG